MCGCAASISVLLAAYSRAVAIGLGERADTLSGTLGAAGDHRSPLPISVSRFYGLDHPDRSCGCRNRRSDLFCKQLFDVVCTVGAPEDESSHLRPTVSGTDRRRPIDHAV